MILFGAAARQTQLFALSWRGRRMPGTGEAAYRYLVLSRKWHVCGLAFLRRSSSSYRMKSKERNMLDDTVVSCKLPIGTFFR